MTNMEYVKHLLDEAKQRHGENAFSTRMLRRQLESMQFWEKREQALYNKFHPPGGTLPGRYVWEPGAEPGEEGVEGGGGNVSFALKPGKVRPGPSGAFLSIGRN